MNEASVSSGGQVNVGNMDLIAAWTNRQRLKEVLLCGGGPPA